MVHTSFRPLEAFRAIQRLLADPDATEEAFNVVRAVDGGGLERIYRRYQAEPTGARMLRERPSLLETLSDRAALESMPEGSLGRAYLAFSDREGISPGGLVEASEHEERELLDPDRRFIVDRMRDSHDLWHVVTGLRTDLAGELSVLSFTTAQTGSIGVAFLVLAGYAHSFTLPDMGERGRRLARESFARGRRAEWLPIAEWEELLPLPLDQVRAELGITAVPVYRPQYTPDRAELAA